MRENFHVRFLGEGEAVTLRPYTTLKASRPRSTALEQQPYSGHVFIFRGRRGDMVKLLWFDAK